MRTLGDHIYDLLQNSLTAGAKNIGICVIENLSENLLRIIITDDGPGIPEGEMEKVLQRFYRVDGSRGIPGHGLGLSFVRAICQLHQMDLILSSASPGLEVTVRFRARQECHG